MTKITHAGFRETLERLLKNTGNTNELRRYVLSYLLAEFNKLPDVGAELEKWLDSISKSKDDEQTLVRIITVKNKLKELQDV